jgi:Y-X(10)_GDL-associated radical SAM protein
MDKVDLPRRYVTAEDEAALHPVHVVWELTLACDLKCQHCGSRAGRRRRNELSTAECLNLIHRIARLGARHVTLIGGEAYLRKDWLEIIRAIRGEGMDCTLQTGGLNLTREHVDRAADAGLQAAGVSIDGLAALHDRLRGVPGSFDAAFAAIRHIRERGLAASANTQITRQVIPELRELWARLLDAGIKDWQVQLTVAMGRAADHPELLLQPYDLLTLMPILAELYHEGAARGLLLQPGNNIGYFGPYESLWRGSGDERVHWSGCNAGRSGIGIEADGTIKGCPSLPTSSYAGGNVRDTPLEQIWSSAPEIAFARERNARPLWGFCASCYYAEVCEGGCTWTTHSLFGRPGNNPYCHHRALELAKRGLRERIVQTERPPGRSFDHGRFELVVEPHSHAASSDATLPPRSVSPDPTGAACLVELRRKLPRGRARALDLCRGCSRYVYAGATVCPHCGGDLRALALDYGERLDRARAAHARLQALMTGRSNARK